MRTQTRPHHTYHLHCKNIYHERLKFMEKVDFLESAIKELEELRNRTGWLSGTAQAQLDLYRSRLDEVLSKTR